MKPKERPKGLSSLEIPKRTSRPNRPTPDQSGNKNIKTKLEYVKKHDLISPNIVLKAVKDSEKVPKTHSNPKTFFAPQLDTSKLKVTKNINNNDLSRTNANVQSKPSNEKNDVLLRSVNRSLFRI